MLALPSLAHREFALTTVRSQGVLPRSLGAHEDVRSALDKSFPPTDPAVRSVVGISPETAGSWDVLAGTYPTARRQDGTKRQDYVRLHTNFPHHKAGLLRILGLIPSQHSAQSTPSEAEAMKAVTREQVAHALTLWDAQDFEKVARERGMCATMMRTEQEWESSEMGKAVRQWLEEDGGGPVKVRRIEAGGKAGGPEQDPDRTSFMEDRKIAEKATISLLDNCVFSTSTEPAPPLPLSVNFGAKDTENASQTRVGKADSSSKDSGRALRIIDMSRVIAAPVAGRVLAGECSLILASSLAPTLSLAAGHREPFQSYNPCTHSIRRPSPLDFFLPPTPSTTVRIGHCAR